MEQESNLSGGVNQTDYYYYYNYDDSINTIPLEEFIPVAVVYGLTLLLGVIGNVLVIFSISRYRRLQSVTNIFLISLSSADLILVLICVPIKVCFPVIGRNWGAALRCRASQSERTPKSVATGVHDINLTVLPETVTDW